MEDFEKIDTRDSDRQRLLEELRRLIWDELSDTSIGDEKQTENAFYCGILAAIIQCVLDISSIQLTNVHSEAGFNFFYSTLVPRINTFTPVPEERKLIGTELLAHVTQELSRHIEQQMLALKVPPGRKGFLQKIGMVD